MNQVILRRDESLGTFLATEGEEKELRIKSSDEETIEVEFDGKWLGMVDMETFLALCERVLDLWKKKAKV